MTYTPPSSLPPIVGAENDCCFCDDSKYFLASGSCTKEYGATTSIAPSTIETISLDMVYTVFYHIEAKLK